MEKCRAEISPRKRGEKVEVGDEEEGSKCSRIQEPLSVSESLLALEDDLSRDLARLSFSKSKVCAVYNPLDYAREPHSSFVRTYCGGTKKVVLLGMNPGPFGMAQTGVPFGDVATVRDWLGIGGEVGKPSPEHPNRPILGFACTRSEVSGSRLWGLIRSLCPSDNPKEFFEHFYIHNYCPLVFMAGNGRNITPPSLAKEERRALESLCDASLRRVLELLQPELSIGLGKYTSERLVCLGLGRTGTLLHPSPINPAANKPPGWAHKARSQLEALGVLSLITPLPPSSSQEPSE